MPQQPHSVELVALREVELKPSACLVAADKPTLWIETKFSSYIHVTAWVQNFAQVFLACVKHHTPIRKLQLTPADITSAELFLRKSSQSRSYSSELTRLNSCPPQAILNSSSLLKLHPFLGQDGLLHIGGRLSQSPIADSQRFPVIISAKDHLTVLITMYFWAIVVQACCFLIQGAWCM